MLGHSACTAEETRSAKPWDLPPLHCLEVALLSRPSLSSRNRARSSFVTQANHNGRLRLTAYQNNCAHARAGDPQKHAALRVWLAELSLYKDANRIRRAVLVKPTSHSSLEHRNTYLLEASPFQCLCLCSTRMLLAVSIVSPVLNQQIANDDVMRTVKFWGGWWLEKLSQSIDPCCELVQFKEQLRREQEAKRYQ
eukprot:3240456-Amphidinium_carterae.1